MTRLKHWEKVLNDNDYHLEYDEYLYWNHIPFAVNDHDKNDRFALAYELCANGSSSIFTTKHIVANTKNLYALKQMNSNMSDDSKVFEIEQDIINCYYPNFSNNSIIRFNKKDLI